MKRSLTGIALAIVLLAVPNSATAAEKSVGNSVGQIAAAAAEQTTLQLKNAPCASTNMCFYPCYLAESCNPWISGLFSHAGCNITQSGGFQNLTYSIKNNTSRKYIVYHTTNCTGTSSPLWPHSSGNMNNEWAGAGIKSFALTVI